MFTKQEIKKSITPALYELGLKEKEIELYILAISNGSMKVSRLATYMNMPSPNVYKIIESLAAYNLTNYLNEKGRGRLFSVESPSVVIDLLKSKREKINQIQTSVMDDLPNLLANYHQGDVPLQVRILQGKDQWENAIVRTINQAKITIDFFGSIKDFMAVSPDTFSKLTQRRVQKNVIIRALIFDDPEIKNFKKNAGKELREVKVLKNMDAFKTSFQITSSQSIIWQPGLSLGIEIDDLNIVQMFKSIFENFWRRMD